MILLEILMALSLTAILLTFLFSFFVESVKIEKKLEIARMTVISRGHLQTRLQTILSAIDLNSIEPFLYTKQFDKEKSLSLVTVFNNGIDPDPNYSGSVRGRIFLDEERNLCLLTSPLGDEKEKNWRKETILPHVESFEFEFLGKKTASERAKNEKTTPITATLAWRTEWTESQGGIPSVVRLRVIEQKSKEPLRFAFILPSPDPFVTYLEKVAL